MRLRDLYPYSKAKLRAASPLGEATGATRRNKSFREFLRKSYSSVSAVLGHKNSPKVDAFDTAKSHRWGLGIFDENSLFN